MNIEKFLDLGTEIESQISLIYEKVAKLTVDEAVSEQLIKISREELNHANSLKMGKNYLKQAPDLFLAVNMNEEELNAGLTELGIFQTRLKETTLLLPALKWLLDLEKKFERIHIGVSVLLADVHLKELFQTLSKGDQNHVVTLTQIISGYEGK
jgi:rubrerythrin